MSEKIGFDILEAVLLFILNPVLIVTLIVAVGVGYFRVKQERRSFKVRVLPGITELKKVLAESWPYALVLSILFCGIGLVVEPILLALMSIVMVVTLLSFFYKVASPIYFIAIATIGMFILNKFDNDSTTHGWSLGSFDISGDMALTIPIIAGLLLVVEGMLIARHTSKYASPFLVQTNRGMRAASFKVKRLWLLPVVFLIPGDMISNYLPYWPQFTLNESQFSFLPIPLIIGFSQIARATFPDVLMPKVGKAIVWTGVGVIVVGISAIWLPMLGWIALLIGVITRIAISIYTSVHERSGSLIAPPSSASVVIAAVLPGSPGEKMGLQAGEKIRSVNGIQVTNEKELYDAIQVNAAHCRIQVLDRNGEVRLMQQVIYRHDHHRLGLLVVR